MNDMGAENGLKMDSRDENISESANKVSSSKPIVEVVCVEIAPTVKDDKTSKGYHDNSDEGKSVSYANSRLERFKTNALKGSNGSVATSQNNMKLGPQFAGDDSLNATTSLSTRLPVHVPPTSSVQSEIDVAEKHVRQNMAHEKPTVVDNDIPAKTCDANQSPRDGLTIQTNNVHSDVITENDDTYMDDAKSSQTEKHPALPQNPLVCKENLHVGPSVVSPFNKRNETTSSVEPIQSTIRNMTDSLHTNKSLTATMSGVKEEKTIPVQRIKKSHKSELELMFAPYILPGDKSLDDARSRLKTAIEQTRLLREAFTERLYEKFRIVLKPVPKSSDPLFHDIRSNPKVVHQRLQQQVSVLQNEKEVERRISQQINLEFAASNNSSDTTPFLGGLPGVDNAEQLSWFGAGLSLVILPEDDANEAELAARGIKERSPIDPETGGKIKDISTAAAVAGSAMLDRVRKGSEIRKHRIQSQQAGKSETDFFDMQVASSLLHNNTIQNTSIISLVSPKTKGMKRERGTKTSKISRSKGTTSLTSFLSISPDVEGLRPSGRPSAVVHALLNNNLKNMTSTTSKVPPFQHNVRHPFPQSKGARMGKPSEISDGDDKQTVLPSAFDAYERKEKIASSKSISVEADKSENDTCLTVQTLLHCLVSDDDRKKEPNCSSSTNGRNRLRLKRKVSEIGILLKSNTVKQKARTSHQVQDSHGISRVDPYLALAVMQSLGLVQKSSSSHYDLNEDEECVAIDCFVKGLAISDDKKSMAGSDTSFTKPGSTNSLPAFRLASVATEIFDRNQRHTITEMSLQKESSRSEDRFFDDSQRSISTKVTKETYITANKGDNGRIMHSKPPIENRHVATNASSEKSSNSLSSNEVLKENKGCPMKLLEQDITVTKFPSQLNRTTLDSVHTMTNQQHQSYAVLAAGMMTDQVSHAFYQHGSNQNNGIVSTVNPVSVQRQDIQHIDSQNQFRPPSIQFLDSAQMQNRNRLQQASLHSGNFPQSGPGDIGDYFKNMHQVMPQPFASSRSTDWLAIAKQQNLLQGIPCAPADPSTLQFYGNRNTHIMMTAEQQQLQSQFSGIPLSVSGISSSQGPREYNEQVDRGGNRFPKSKNTPAGKVKGEKKNENRECTNPATSSNVVNGPSSAPPKERVDASKPTQLNSILSSGIQSKSSYQVPSQDKVAIKRSNSNNKIIEAPMSRGPALNKAEDDKSSIDRSIMGKAASISKSTVAVYEKKDNVLVSSEIGLKMTLPSHPAVLSDREVELVVKGYFHEAIRKASKQEITREPTRVKEVVDAANTALCEYLIKVGAAVPIPKALISTKLRDRLNSSVFRTTTTNLVYKCDLSPSPLDIIVSIVTIWLWSHHQNTFKQAFAKSGRLDVDPDCQWLIKAALEKATDVTVTKGLESILKPIHSQTFSTKDIHGAPVKIAKLVSSAINTGIRLDKQVNATLPNFDCLVGYLDDLRMTALRLRCQERGLLASLLAKRTRMSEAFSNAYTSSMVRAGAALGYDDLGEIVQDESTQTSSQLPFDILIDATGAWEDPCRSKRGYGTNLDSDALLKRAHARAMIQRSLKRLQDRYGIKGGTKSAGPYSESFDQASPKCLSSPRPSPRSGNKRKASFSSADFLKNMNAAATTALFNPNHFSAPFIWDDTVENTPYGRHGAILNGRLRSPSVMGDKLLPTSKRLKTTDDDAQNLRSTCAIEWEEVARMFEDVKPIEKTSSSRANDHNVAVPLGSTIFAPFCRKIDPEELPSDSDSDAEEENLEDNYILSGHQKVLDSIKDKFDMMMKIRQEYQDRTRRLSFGR
jgi:hypothetical protein